MDIANVKAGKNSPLVDNLHTLCFQHPAIGDKAIEINSRWNTGKPDLGTQR
jgi:hypothetical protein